MPCGNHENTIILTDFPADVKEEVKRVADQDAKAGYWAVLPAPVRYADDLQPSAKILFAEISSLTHDTGYCYASNEYFQKLYGLSERTISRLIKALEARGFIRIENGDSFKRRIYAGINPLNTNPDKNDGVHRQKRLPNPDKNDGQNKKGNRKANNPPIAPQGAGADFVPKKTTEWKPERFAAFWDFYPLHKSKQAAIRAWDKLKPSDELLAVIGKALVRQIAEAKAKAEKEHRPYEWKLYAATFLNGARWTDEPGDADAEDDTAPEQRLAGERC